MRGVAWLRWVLMLWMGMSGLAGAENQAVGVVLAVSGQAEVVRGQQHEPLARRSAVQLHDELRTGDNARLQMKLVDGTVTTLGANTVYRIDSFDWHPKAAKEADAQFTMVRGAFRTVTGHLLDVAGSRYEVNTAVGVIGIRGTEFWGGNLDSDAVEVLLINGEHAVHVRNDKGEVVLHAAGEGTTLKADGSEPVLKVWPKEKVARAAAKTAL